MLSAQMQASGVNSGDVLLCRKRTRPTPSALASGSTASAAAQASGGGAGRASDGSGSGIPPGLGASLTWDMVPGEVMKNPARVHQLVREYPHLLELVRRSNPEFHTAASDPDPAALRKYYLLREMKRAEGKMREDQLRARLEANPMDLEAQRELAEAIRKANVDANMEMALEHTPESFGRVTMLYIDAEVNRTPLKAFVDSGAQSTIMSAACAERCGIMHLLDTRFAGTAVGVGSAPILGRVHMAQLRIGTTFFPCTFTVLEKDDIDFLFGLDMLKRHRCIIDLQRNELHLEGANGAESVPFLAEKDVPKSAFGADAPRQAASVAPPGTTAQSQPAPAASASASAPAPPPAAAPSPSQAGLENLMALGFGREQCEAALRSTGGDAEQAAALLLASR